MARLFSTTYDSCVGKVALDRQLAAQLANHRNPNVRNTAWRIARCADSVNCWLINAPESGWIHGRFWKCRSKLCSYCLSDESRRRRRKLRDALDLYNATATNQRWQFVTLTIENPAASISTTRSIVNDAWAKLRKRACFAAVQAGCKSEEFTLTKLGFHYHIHALLDARKPFSKPNGNYTNANGHRVQRWKLTTAGVDLKRSWTECVERSGGQSQRLFGFNTYDGYLIIDARQVTDQRQVTNELCKYVTKSTGYNSLSNAAIAELADQKRWSRMFELLGKMSGHATRSAKPQSTQHTNVHTKRLSDGLHTDRQTFENKRSNQRYFAIDQLEATFGAKCWSLDEMQAAIRQHTTL